MLDRYTITLNPDELALVLGAEVPDVYQPQYNAAPTKILPIITSSDSDKISLFNWGLMAMWSNNRAMSPKFFNLPMDSVINKASYRKKLATHRCVIPMDGFYLWKQVAKKQQVPHYFFYPDKKVFSVAGLWEEGDDGTHSFIMITRPANEQISDFQEDMPAILDTANTRKWLQSDDQEELQTLLNIETKDELISHTVSPKIKDIDGNDGSFIKPAPASDQHGNYTLFT
ncbi:Putative SOS response-associated peptidase YedK [Ekhidna lutea]|uniref:Abasic site processing protein n=1 Tax=Ekhidna lutea TaxID=447679 RepID=A0A239K2W8_EKHLU|nr:SOS response-associated peptidase [Ekhidna lutea]SNT12435.1 Putative SOS response-associated peptidase YedK [Ekhidna lutea]